MTDCVVARKIQLSASTNSELDVKQFYIVKRGKVDIKVVKMADISSPEEAPREKPSLRAVEQKPPKTAAPV